MKAIEEDYEPTFEEMKIISHTLGIDLFDSVMSHREKDKKLPSAYYRNYYNTNNPDKEIVNLVKLGLMELFTKDYYQITLKGKFLFGLKFREMAIYRPKKDRDLAYLKHRINFYCEFYRLKFCDDNSEHVISAYLNYWVKKLRVSHTTEQTIRRFMPELRKLNKEGIL